MMKILISGAGIAGPTLAYWLSRYRMEPTIVEIAPRLRTGGYMIDFWGAGFDIAERMGLREEITDKGYTVRQVRIVNREGRRVSGFPADVFTRVTNGHYVSLPRGDLAAIIFGKLGGGVETIFGDGIAGIEQTSQGVQVRFERGPARRFDLVIGADGLHSRVRELVFGPQSRYEKYLGYKVGAFVVDGYEPRDELVYVMYTQIGQWVARFAMRDGSTVFMFAFRHEPEKDPPEDDVTAQKALLRKRFGGSGWECPQILEALDTARDFYFDRVSQIHMNAEPGLWTRGRVSLLGDAAFCVSLLAGQGSALAMVAAYILAGELHRANGDYTTAFAQYQERFGPFVFEKQKAAVGFASTFAPESAFSLFLRNQVMKLLTVPWVASYIFGKGLADKIVLPEYEEQPVLAGAPR